MKPAGASPGEELEPVPAQTVERKVGEGGLSCADSSMGGMAALTTHAGSSTTATYAMVNTPDGNTPTTHSRGRRGGDVDRGRPWFMRFAFSVDGVGHTLSVTYTEMAFPVPTIPKSDLQYKDISSMITDYPHLFEIIMPVHTKELEHIFSCHPNCALVDSICKGFREGFWPFADTADLGQQPIGSVT